MHLHVKHTRDVPDLKGQRWGLCSKRRLVCIRVCNSNSASKSPGSKLQIFAVAAECATPSWSSLVLLIASSANQQPLNRVGVAFEPSGFLLNTPFLINSVAYNMNFIDPFSFFMENVGSYLRSSWFLRQGY